MVSNYVLKGTTLTTETVTKYLGVDIQSDLSWKSHVNRTANKGNSMLGFLKRNLKSTSQETKTRAYNSLVRSGLEYCSTVWNPHHNNQVQPIEMVQRRAARFATERFHNTSSVSDMLTHLGWETLQSRRTKHQLTMTYKIMNNLVDIPAQNFFTQARSSLRANHRFKLNHFQTSTDAFKFSFFPRTVPVWNSLPAAVAEAPSLASFKEGLKHLTF